MELRQCTCHCRTPNSYSSFCSSSGRRSNCAVTTIVQIQTSVRELLQGYWYFQCYCASLLLDLSVLGWLRAAEPRRPEAPGGRNKSARANWGIVYVGQIFTHRMGQDGAAPVAPPAAGRSRDGSCAVVMCHVEPPGPSWSTVYYL